MEPLIAGASWANVPARSAVFLVNIGRMGGISKVKLEELLESYNKNALITAAIHAGDRVLIFDSDEGRKAPLSGWQPTSRCCGPSPIFACDASGHACR
jgi:hypothetical protein